MKTRAVLALSALLASGLAAGAANAAVKPKPKPVTPVCPSFTDPAKDDLNGDTAKGGVNAEDPALDIVKTTESIKAGTVTMAITVSKLADPSVSDGSRYFVGFTAGGKVVQLFGTRSRSKPVMTNVFTLGGIKVDGKTVSGTEEKVTLTEDAATNTVKFAVSLADLSAAVGSKLDGLTATALESQVQAYYPGVSEPYDVSSAPATVKLKVADCK